LNLYTLWYYLLEVWQKYNWRCIESMDKSSFKEKWKSTVNRKRFMGFVDKYGFYIVLLLCLCIIGATAFLTFDGKSEGDQGSLDAADEQDGSGITTEGSSEGSPEDIDIVITDVNEGEQSSPQPGQTADPGGEPAGVGSQTGSDEQLNAEEPSQGQNMEPGTAGSKPDTADPNPGTSGAKGEAAVSASAGVEEETGFMEMPAAGDIVRAYAIEELVYSPTLKEWTTHVGIDIGGTLGGEVRAALAGTVESIEEDPLKGIVITLSHDDGLKTVYTGLSAKDMVRVGQTVEKGQVISGVGRTAAFEITDDTHVHFEVLLNGEYQDPAKYLKL
jgi:murein DD-endopeptidase MepM/ murein hydrolase activator NlpD